MSIHIVSQRNVYEFFRDYCDSLLHNIVGMDVILFNKVEDLTINETDLYIFCQTIPDHLLSVPIRYKICLINTEQLTIDNWQGKCMPEYIKKIVSLGIYVIDYDEYQSKLFSLEKHIHVPYQYYSAEGTYMTNLLKNTEKIYDVAFCSVSQSTRRRTIYDELIQRGLKVVNVTGWKQKRDSLIAKAKILINVHYSDNYQIFEHLRCDRWTLTGQLVVSEPSQSDSMLDIKDLLIIESYDKIVDLIIDIVNNYDQYYSRYIKKLQQTKDSIIKKRLEHYTNFINTVTNQQSNQTPTKEPAQIVQEPAQIVQEPILIPKNISSLSWNENDKQINPDIYETVCQKINDEKFQQLFDIMVNHLQGKNAYVILEANSNFSSDIAALYKTLGDTGPTNIKVLVVDQDSNGVANLPLLDGQTISPQLITDYSTIGGKLDVVTIDGITDETKVINILKNSLPFLENNGIIVVENNQQDPTINSALNRFFRTNIFSSRRDAIGELMDSTYVWTIAHNNPIMGLTILKRRGINVKINAESMRTITIQNCADSHINGRYIYDPSLNLLVDRGSKVYVKDSTHHIYRYNGEWRIANYSVKLYYKLDVCFFVEFEFTTIDFHGTSDKYDFIKDENLDYRTELEGFVANTAEEIKSRSIENCTGDKLITFITPTIGRPSLANAIRSVMDQTLDKWRYIIAFDGVQPSDEILDMIKDDPRISYNVFPKAGFKNCAGAVRNKAIQIADTDWIGFIDDDDLLSPNYVECLESEIKKVPDAECVIFRMILNNQVVPDTNQKNFRKNDVGISFAYKRALFNTGFKFKPSCCEDFDLLNLIRSANKKIVMSKYICYFVRFNNITKDHLITYRYISSKIRPTVIN